MKRKSSEGNASDWMEPFKAPCKRITLNAGLIDVRRFVHESPNAPIASHAILSLTNAPDLIREAGNLQAGRKRGGKKAAATNRDKAEAWQRQCVIKARALLDKGASPRDLAGVLAPKFQRDAGTVRRVLKKAGVR